MGAEPFHIRNARLPDDKPSILRFIRELQHFEKELEPDRRIDADVAEEYYAVLTARAREQNGCIFIAENEARQALGWAVAHEENNEVYVIEAERRFGYISELYVLEEVRGKGIGRALIAACEDWARSRDLRVMMIAALARNRGALNLYRGGGYAPYSTYLRKYLP